MVDLQSLRTLWRQATPSLALIAAVILMVTPLRLFQGYVPTPWLPLLIVYLYAVYDTNAIPTVVIFAAGIFQDLLYGAGIGIWATAYLAIQYLVYSQQEYLDGRQPRVVWAAFAVGAMIIAFIIYVLRSFLAVGFQPLGPLLYQLFITIAVYPLVSMLFFWLRARRVMAEDRER